MSVSLREAAILFLLGLVVALGVASLQELPGYMDADYYFAGGLQLVEGRGFNEPYLWNYLDDPDGLPHPSHAYWFPLSSILAAASMCLAGARTYAGARLAFLLIAASVPLVTALLSLKVAGRRELALLSGLLAVFSIYHAPFLPVTDNFGPVMLLGAAFFLLVTADDWRASLAIGVCAGLSHLARNDGLIWLGLAWYAGLLRAFARTRERRPGLRCLLAYSLLVFAGYLVVMGPWFLRNFLAFGAPIAPGGSRILWLTDYNDTFAFPADTVNPASWWEAGWREAVRVRLWALRMNLLNAFAAQGGILLFPFILLGLWSERRTLRGRLAAAGWAALLFVMTVIFPFAGARGGFFHAGAAFQPYWWALAPLGLERLTAWIRNRGWLDDRAYGLFRGALVAICVLLTAMIVWLRVLAPGWGLEHKLYRQAEPVLVAHGARPSEIVIVRNPPGYYLVSGRPAIVMPPGGPASVLALAERYQAAYFILEPAGVLADFQELYAQYEGYPGFHFLGEVDGARIFAIEFTD